jgi:hypothetical protein
LLTEAKNTHAEQIYSNLKFYRESNERSFLKKIGDSFKSTYCYTRSVILGLDGKCRLTKLDGSVYDGEWKNRKKNGEGKYITPGGSVFEGEWEDDLVSIKAGELGYWKFPISYLSEKDGKVVRSWYTKELRHESKKKIGSLKFTYPIYSDNGLLEEKLIRVNLTEINRLLNRGINSLDDLITEGAIVDVTDGVEEAERVRNFEEMIGYLRKSTEQMFRCMVHHGEDLLDSGQQVDTINLIQLASVNSLDELNLLRFFDRNQYQDEVKEDVKSAYNNIESFLRSFGIEDINAPGIKDQDFFSTTVGTTRLDHAVSLTVNLNMVRELIRNGKNLEDIDNPVLLCFDSSRAIERFGSEDNLGNITSNCMFANRRNQAYQTCWLHALATTAIMTESLQLFEKMNGGTIRLYAPENKLKAIIDYLELVGHNELPSELLVEKELKIQSIVDQYGVGQLEDQPMSKLVATKNIVKQIMRYQDNDKLLEEFERRVGAVVGEEVAIEYRHKLRTEIEKIDSKYDSGQYPNASATINNLKPKGKTFLKTLEKIRAFYMFGNKLTGGLSEIEEDSKYSEQIEL